VEAEEEGTVAEIRCEEGQSVTEGDVLVVLE
jgi:biotin carboxyl carrier protein